MQRNDTTRLVRVGAVGCGSNGSAVARTHRARPPARSGRTFASSTESVETPEEADLAVAVGAMLDEGAPPDRL
jgi:hypothetical protein